MAALTRGAALASLGLCCALGAARGEAIDAVAVQRCLSANAPEHSSRYHLGFAARDARGHQSEQRAQLFWKRFPEEERRVLLRLEAPEKVAGAALLAIVKPGANPEIYLRLPELENTQRIYRVEQLRGFLGRGGVELAELWRMLESTPALAARLISGDAEVAGRPAWIVEGDFPVPRQQTPERVVSRIDQQTCVPLRVESLGPKGEVRRRLEVDPARLEAIGQRWLARELVFSDLRDGSSATVDVLSVEIDTDVPAGLLTRKALARRP
jgi:hypothetical protein